MCNISVEITLKRKTMKAFISRCVLVAATLSVTGLVAEAQFGKNLLNKVVQNASEKQVSAPAEANTNVSTGTNADAFNGKAYYVSIEKGSARGAGTKEAPMKDIQKAIDSAADGDVIRIAQGNYLGPLDRGWIQIKGKYVSLEGGWNGDFTERNPVKYITRIQPSVAQRGTIGQGLLMIESISNRNARIVVDGIFFDLGLVHEYAKADPTDERFGCPEGCETGRIMPVGNPPNKTIRLIGGKVSHRRQSCRQARHPQLHVPERLVQRNHHDKHGRRVGNIQQRVRFQPLCFMRDQRRSEPDYQCTPVHCGLPSQHCPVLMAYDQRDGKHGIRIQVQERS